MSRPLTSNTNGLRVAVLAALPELLRQWLPVGKQRDDVYFALNPRRQDRNLGSFQINTHTGQWRDHAIGEGGSDAISLYAYLSFGGDYRAALKALANEPLVQAAMAGSTGAPPAKPAKLAKPTGDKLALVRRLYAKATDLAGMPAATYLQNRGLRPTDAWDGLRASMERYPGFWGCPTLYAPITAVDGSLVGLHRTYLTAAGAKLPVANPRRTLGQVRGNAVRLGVATDRVIICEGLEDGLTLYQRYGVPVWVACGAGFMRSMSIPDKVRTLAIGADNDAAGRLAAQRAADAHNIGGRNVRIIRPKEGFKDYNAELQGDDQ